MQRILRLEKELKGLNTQPLDNIWIEREFDKQEKENDITLKAKIIGTKETLYENGLFELEIIVPERYPFIAPKIRFLTPIYHPNVSYSKKVIILKI